MPHSTYQAFATEKLRAGMKMAQVGEAWRAHKQQSGSGAITHMAGGGMRGGSAAPKKKKKAAPRREYAVLAGRGLGGYPPSVMAGGSMKPVNQLVGGGLGDDILDGIGKVGKTIAPFAPLLGLFL